MNQNTTYKTVNRRWLMNQVAKGNVIARKDHDYTRDEPYANECNKEFKPARISTGKNDWVSGCVNFEEWEFQGKAGGASRCSDSDEIHFYIHSNLCYTLKIVEGK